MDCKHEQLRCTDNVFYCVLCGAKLPEPGKAEESAVEKPAKKPVKRRTRKGDE